MRLMIASLFFILVACTTTPAEPIGPSYYVMRHLQKGTGPDPALSEEGTGKAAILADLLAPRRPRAIYVSTTRRALGTAAPLATRLGITPKTYDPSNTPGLIEMVLRETGPVLIVGHSNTVPEIIERLGGTRPADLGESDYGDVWHIKGPTHIVEKWTIGTGDVLKNLPS